MHVLMEFVPFTELSQDDREAIVRNLDLCLVILDGNMGRRSLTEIKVRSMIAVLRVEMSKAVSNEATFPPFAFKPSSETQYRPGQR